MPRLSDTQLVILSNAAKRDGVVLPLPKSLKINEGAVATVLKSLIGRGLIQERAAVRDEPAWREDKDGTRLTLVLSDDGFDAIGVGQAPPRAYGSGAAARRSNAKRVTAPSPAHTNSPETSAPAARSGSKQALLIDLLKRKGGATIDEAVAATGWQRHTVRGVISGALKKKLGLTVVSASVDGRGRVYQIAERS